MNQKNYVKYFSLTIFSSLVAGILMYLIANLFAPLSFSKEVVNYSLSYSPLSDNFARPRVTKIYIVSYQKSAGEKIKLYCRALDARNNVVGSGFNIPYGTSSPEENPDNIPGSKRRNQFYLRKALIDGMVREIVNDPERVTFYPVYVSYNGKLYQTYRVGFDNYIFHPEPVMDPSPPAPGPAWDHNWNGTPIF